MITTSQALEDIIVQRPFIEEGLALGIINVSALARELIPELEKRLLRTVKPGAVVMALNRLSATLQSKTIDHSVLSQLGDLTVRSNLIEFTYANSETLLSKHTELLAAIATRRDVFVTLTQGIHETTIFVSMVMENDVEQIFSEEKLLSKFSDLSSITIRLTPDAVHMPGIFYLILKQLAWEGISVVDNVSTFTEFTVILEKHYVDRAFSVLKNLTE